MVNNLLTVGQSALNNFQVALNVHGSNIANASTDGYVRRTVNFTSQGYTTSGVGMGADIQSIVRNLDSFLERRYLTQSSSTSYYDTVNSNLSQVESLFNSTDDTGISASLDAYVASLENLASTSSNAAVRNETISSAETLAEMLNSMSDSLDTMVDSLNDAIEDQVETVNALIDQIAALNKSIAQTTSDSGLYDQRDQLLQELASYVDIDVTAEDDGQVTVRTSEGQPLVAGTSSYSFTVLGAHSTAALSADSGFDGQLYFEGTSANELTVKFTSDGDTSGGSTAATFQVSLDGGKTWVTDEDGNVATFTAGDSEHKAVVDGVSIWFGTADDPDTAPTTSISEGDKFTVMPKTGVYWVTATGGLVNVTPMAGNDNASRLSGGSLAGLLATRDEYVGSYQDSLDAFSESLIWNTNRTHSQGAGLTNFDQVQGEYAVTDTSVPLGSNSGLYWGDYLEAGNISIALYDEATGENISVTALDFSSVTPGASSFDPSVHSLEDVRDAINATYSGQLTASIVNGQLSIEAADGVEFQFAEDSSGLLAGLGINTFFSGTNAGNISVNSAVADDPNRLCCGHVNGDGEVNTGDNTTALALAAMADKGFTFHTASGTTTATFQDFMTTLASKVGSDVNTVNSQYIYSYSLSADLATQRENVSGVSLDEEMTRVMQYQQYYQAAAKLIETANEMFDVVMSLK